MPSGSRPQRGLCRPARAVAAKNASSPAGITRTPRLLRSSLPPPNRPLLTSLARSSAASWFMPRIDLMGALQTSRGHSTPQNPASCVRSDSSFSKRKTPRTTRRDHRSTVEAESNSTKLNGGRHRARRTDFPFVETRKPCSACTEWSSAVRACRCFVNLIKNFDQVGCSSGYLRII